ncbi:MAG: hypothetical protein Q9162_000400 [Coniocarpon cinnabarinum]
MSPAATHMILTTAPSSLATPVPSTITQSSAATTPTLLETGTAGGMSGGAKAGVAVGVILGVALIAGVVAISLWLLRRRKRTAIQGHDTRNAELVDMYQSSAERETDTYTAVNRADPDPFSDATNALDSSQGRRQADELAGVDQVYELSGTSAALRIPVSSWWCASELLKKRFLHRQYWGAGATKSMNHHSEQMLHSPPAYHFDLSECDDDSRPNNERVYAWKSFIYQAVEHCYSGEIEDAQINFSEQPSAKDERLMNLVVPWTFNEQQREKGHEKVKLFVRQNMREKVQRETGLPLPWTWVPKDPKAMPPTPATQ